MDIVIALVADVRPRSTNDTIVMAVNAVASRTRILRARHDTSNNVTGHSR
mgnify:CR=1 FL=1